MRFVLALLLAASALPAANELANRRAPGFSLADRTMRQHDLADYRGKIVLVDMMLTNCPHCKTLAATLNEIKAKYGDQVQVLSIVVPPDNVDGVNRFIAEQKFTSPILFDCGQVMASYLKITPQNPKVEFPHVFLVDAQGWIRADYGPQDKDFVEGKGLFAEIDKALKAGVRK